MFFIGSADWGFFAKPLVTHLLGVILIVASFFLVIEGLMPPA